jgi:uncharacterized protein (DUF58 family)
VQASLTSLAARLWPGRAGARRRDPATVVLNRHTVYILPTRAGALFAAVVTIMLLTAINYQLALGYALTFLLASLGVVAMIHTWRNLLGLTLRPGRAEPVHAGELAEFGLMVRNDSRLERFALALSVPGTTEVTRLDVSPQAEQMISVVLPTDTRGWLDIPRMRLETIWPLGLWCAWARWHPTGRVLVLPRPETPAMPLPNSELAGSEPIGRLKGEDDVAAIRPYRVGDSPRRLAWKAMARTGGDALLVREFEGGSGGTLKLEWSSLPANLSVEDRLSRLTRWVIDAEAAGLRYGLSLAKQEIAADAGPAHRAECLRALALAEV